MPTKKAKAAKRKQGEITANGASTPESAPSLIQSQTEDDKPALIPITTNGIDKTPPPPDSKPQPQEPAEEKAEEKAPGPPTEDPDNLKEQGNEAFKAKRYGEAIDLYSRAIALRPTEPTYLTNRAACNMALKLFRPALADCLAAIALQTKAANVNTNVGPSSSHSNSALNSPVGSSSGSGSGASPKILVRLAKCHLALGSPRAALSTVRTALSIDASTPQARDVERAALRMEGHLTKFEAARKKGDWGHARLALDQAGRECEGSEPVEWRCWRIELELAKGKWEGAMVAANEAFQIDKKSPDVLCLRGLVMFLSSKLPSALQHVQQALTYDPEHTRARKLLRRIKDVERLKEEGNVHFKAGRLEEALERYTAALGVVEAREEESKGGAIRAMLLSNRATALLKLDRKEEALADTNASLELVSTSYKALRTRARIELTQEAYEEAVRDFKAALEQVRVDGSQAEERGLRGELKDAEVALKRSKTKDYYKILGIPKDSTESDIKKAYRKQSLLHHPDKGGDEEKFKLASEAYNVLSDPQKRARYDAGEDDEGGMGMGGMQQADLSELFASFGGGGFGFGGRSGGFEAGGNPFGGGRFHSHSSRGSYPF